MFCRITTGKNIEVPFPAGMLLATFLMLAIMSLGLGASKNRSYALAGNYDQYIFFIKEYAVLRLQMGWFLWFSLK
jgi:hypothetical protein